MKSAPGEVVYVCQGCKQRVEVCVPAKVTCSRCGRPMKVDDEHEHSRAQGEPRL